MSAATLSTSSKRSCSYRLFVNARPVRAMPDSVSAQRSSSPADGTNGSVTASRRGRAPARRTRRSRRAAFASSPACTLARSRRTTSRISGTASRSCRASSGSISEASISPRVDERVEVGELAAHPLDRVGLRARRPTRAARAPSRGTEGGDGCGRDSRVRLPPSRAGRHARSGVPRRWAAPSTPTRGARAARRRGPRAARRARRPPAPAPGWDRRRRDRRPPRLPARSRMRTTRVMPPRWCRSACSVGGTPRCRLSPA